MLINCYYILEDYDALEASIGLLSDQHPLLNKIAKMFVSVGRCSAAVAAYLKVMSNSCCLHCILHCALLVW